MNMKSDRNSHHLIELFSGRDRHRRGYLTVIRHDNLLPQPGIQRERIIRAKISGRIGTAPLSEQR